MSNVDNDLVAPLNAKYIELYKELDSILKEISDAQLRITNLDSERLELVERIAHIRNTATMFNITLTEVLVEQDIPPTDTPIDISRCEHDLDIDKTGFNWYNKVANEAVYLKNGTKLTFLYKAKSYYATIIDGMPVTDIGGIKYSSVPLWYKSVTSAIGSSIDKISVRLPGDPEWICARRLFRPIS